MKLSEDDQTEYLLYISQKEALTSQGRETMFVNEDEDEDLKAALEASLLDVTENSGNSFEDNVQKENYFIICQVLGLSGSHMQRMGANINVLTVLSVLLPIKV